SQENGFQIKVVLLHEHVLGGSGASFGRWYKVEDPAAYHCRVELINHRRTYICTIARRLEDRRIFARFPQQSDYVEAWSLAKESDHQLLLPKFSTRRQIIPDPMRRMVPNPVKKLARWGRDVVKKKPGAFDHPYYRRVSDDDLVRGRI